MSAPLRAAHRVLLAASILFVGSTSGAPAHAQQPGEGVIADESKRAIALYNEGRDLLTAGKASQALPKLVESLRLLPSPNTELLIAHARRELGRRAEAMETYERVKVNAQNEVARGQARYKGTEDEAARWMTTLAKELGTIVVTAPEGARVEVSRADPKVPALFVGSGRVYVEPGEVRVKATIGERVETKTARVGAGTTARVDFASAPEGAAAGGTAPAPVPDAADKDDDPVVSIPGVVLLGAGAVGMGMFIGFGVSARSKLDELEACTPTCPESDRPKLESGERDQLIANVSLGIGGALLAAGTITWIVEAVLADDAPAKTPAAAYLDLGPGAASFSARF